MTPAASEWLNKVSPGLQEEQVAELRLKIYQQVIGQHLETLLVYVDACRMIPEENLPEIREKVNEAFDQEQLPRMVQAAGVGSVREYEQLLRSQGQSLERMRKMFFERALAQEWLQQNANTSGEIPHAEMIAWYQNHLDEYEFQAKVKFEQMTVKVNQKQPRNQAWNRLAAMGNDVLNGRSFSEVAKESSEGPTASQGGLYEWTTQGSLVSEVIDNAIFSLPVGELSAILDDHQALHIVRVLERSDAGRTPFVEAQVAIRMELRRQQQESTRKEYLDRLKNRTPIWTVFDDKQKNTRLAENPSTTR
jgi:parvulin-like peptidyl-prolyl isomerase